MSVCDILNGIDEEVYDVPVHTNTTEYILLFCQGGCCVNNVTVSSELFQFLACVFTYVISEHPYRAMVYYNETSRA
jgi:hypothetical protein